MLVLGIGVFPDGRCLILEGFHGNLSGRACVFGVSQDLTGFGCWFWASVFFQTVGVLSSKASTETCQVELE